MICYRDRTYCGASTDGRCLNTSCDRFFTEQDKKDAERWWGKPGAPVAFSDFSKDCPDIEEPVHNED